MEGPNDLGLRPAESQSEPRSFGYPNVPTNRVPKYGTIEMAGQNGHNGHSPRTSTHQDHNSTPGRNGHFVSECDNLPHNPPMPETTKRATKRKKYPKKPSMRQPSQIGLIYREGTDCQIADQATLNRLSTTGPSTSTRLAGYNFIWGELPG